MSQRPAPNDLARDASTKLLIVGWLLAAYLTFVAERAAMPRLGGGSLGLTSAVFWAGPVGAAWAYRRRSHRAGLVAALLALVAGVALAWVQRRLQS